MRKILIILLASISVVGFSQKKISDMTEVTTVNSDAVIPLVQSGNNYKATKANLQKEILDSTAAYLVRIVTLEDGIYTFRNGLIESLDTVRLGDTIRINTDIYSGANTFKIKTSQTTNRSGQLDFVNGYVSIKSWHNGTYDTDEYAAISVNDARAAVTFNAPLGLYKEIRIDSTQLKVTDQVHSKGLENAANYSANTTALSLIDSTQIADMIATDLVHVDDSISVHGDSISDISGAVRDVVSADALSRIIVDTLFIESMKVYIYSLNDSMMFVDDHYGPFSLGMLRNATGSSTPSLGAESRWFFENNGNDEELRHNLSANGGATYGTAYTPIPQGSYYGDVNVAGRYFSYDSLSYGDAFTIAVEVYPSAGDYLTVWSMFKDDDGIEIQIDQRNDDIYVITGSGGAATTASALNCGVASEEWQSLIVTVDRSGGTCAIWLDGVDETTSASISTTFDNSSPAWFGRSMDDDRQFFIAIDAAQLYFWKITDANIATIVATPGTEVTQ